MNVSIEDFTKQMECTYKGERYSVRDNGAVFRHSRPEKIIRKHDNYWTFGTQNDRGYLVIASEVVHRIVAFAFLGDPPTPKHVVDHLDTNRHNNRPENLRWLTKLENILNNPITVKKIIFRCGSIKAFLEDPSILRKYEIEDSNFGWMRTVTSEEAKIAWKRLNEWAKKENNSKPTGVKLGEWVFHDNENNLNLELVDSITQNAKQENWKIPFEFPCCPQNIINNPIEAYASNLKAGKVFSQNNSLKSIVTEFKISQDRDSIVVLSKVNQENVNKPWLLAQITFVNGYFLHTHLGDFDLRIGTDKFFSIAQELTWK